MTFGEKVKRGTYDGNHLTDLGISGLQQFWPPPDVKRHYMHLDITNIMYRV